MAGTKQAEAAQPSTAFENARRWAFGGLALLAVAGAILRVIGFEAADREAIYFLIVAGVLLTLERLRKFSFGKDGLSFEAAEAIKAEVAAVRQVAVENQLIAKHGAGGRGRKAKASAAKATAAGLPAPSVDDDPQKGRFGGKAESNGRRLSAKVWSAEGVPGFYSIHLKVESTDKKRPLTGSVRFYLHDTFSPDQEACTVADGVAKLDLVGYGAFTVGAVADEGDTLLELDLAEDDRFPKAFRDT